VASRGCSFGCGLTGRLIAGRVVASLSAVANSLPSPVPEVAFEARKEEEEPRLLHGR